MDTTASQGFTRRRFLKTAAAVTLAGPVMKAEAGEELIDIHQHVNFHGRNNEAFVRHQEAMGATLSVLLPAGSVTQTPRG